MTNQGDLAYEKYLLLNKENVEIRNLVVDYFTKRNSATILTLEKLKAIDILKNNFLSSLLTLKDGKYKLFIDKKGKATVFDGKIELFFSFNDVNNITTIKVNDFDIPVNSEYNFEVTSESDNKTINDYTSTFDFDNIKNPTVVYLNKQEIPKGKYWKMQVIVNNKNIDGITIGSTESMKFVSDHKLKKDHTGAVYYVFIIGLGLLYVLAALSK